MKISNSKKELARIISENGGWRDGAESAWFQGINNGNECHEVWFGAYGAAPEFSPGIGFTSYHSKVIATFSSQKFPNWHQSILSRAEYFHLHPAPDSDNGSVNLHGKTISIEGVTIGGKDKFIAVSQEEYLPHTEQAKSEFCDSVMRSIPEPEYKPSIEQLMQRYADKCRSLEIATKHLESCAKRVGEAMKELSIACKACGFEVSPITTKQEPELVITDWLGLQVGDEVEIIESCSGERAGHVGVITNFSRTDEKFRVRVCFNGNIEDYEWLSKWRFIRRP